VTDFLDANVVLYIYDSDRRKREIADAVLRQALAGEGTISFQVVQEVLNVMLRRSHIPSTEIDLNQTLQDVLLPLWTVRPSQDLYQRAIAVQARYGYGFYDSLIIAAALEAGCDRLYSEDMQDGQHIEGLTIVNPFA
jgi:predicted nucleic acid-binding protein